jgi:NAD(P)-dependent dehydrogenase (short-subunit alcohol dehydrogenase family)
MQNNPFDLTGKTALITGGNGGIGLGIAKAVAGAGADVCIWGTNSEKNEMALEELNQYESRISAQICDVSDREAVDKCFDSFINKFGRIDACYANAGIAGHALSFLRIKQKDWQNILNVNLTGAFNVLQKSAGFMVSRSKNDGVGGRLIVTSSLSAMEGFSGNEPYASTKGGLVSMIKSLAVEFARYGITANSIMPGWIETDIIKKHMDSKRFAEAVMPRIPVRRWGRPEDIGGLAVYLMSDASSYHTGDNFIIDGGYSIF